MKKIWFLLCSILLVSWITFADVIPENSHYVDKCVKIEKTRIGNYKVVVKITPPAQTEVYEPKSNECLRQHYRFWGSLVYLVKDETDAETLLNDVPDDVISLWSLRVNGNYYDNSMNNRTSYIEETYRIVENNWDYTLELVDNVSNNMNMKDIINSEDGIDILKLFLIAWIRTIIIETIILFLLAKLFWKDNKISNIRLILFWILASSITLPFLWFILPSLISNTIVYTIIGELLVTIIEVVILKYWLKISWTKAIIASAACNLCSYLFWVFAL